MNNCPLGKKDSHACWECIYCIKRFDDNGVLKGCFCSHPKFEEPINDKNKPVTIEQELTAKLFEIVEDLYAREWSFNVLDDSKTYKQLCGEGIEILKSLGHLDGGNE